MHCGKKVFLGGLVCDGALYIYLSKSTLERLSKQCLVSFLDYAQDELKLRVAYLFFKRSLPNYKKIMHSFNFFGFVIVSPDHFSPFAGSRRRGTEEETMQPYLLMAYELDEDED